MVDSHGSATTDVQSRQLLKIGFGESIEHVDFKVKCTREYVERGLIEAKYVCSKE